MKFLVVALCALAAAAGARRARSLAHAHAYDAHLHYEEPHAVEYYTVQALPTHYELGARHEVRSARTQYRVQLPVTYEYTYETAPATSVVSYEPAYAARAHWHEEAW